MNFLRFVKGSILVICRGNWLYYSWIAYLLLLIIIGLIAYLFQLQNGLIVTNMRDQVSWGFYIGNFTFLVGVAAAAIALVIPAYLYHWEPIKEIVIFGEILAVSAILMCLGFVMVDIGRPLNFWHLIPFVGKLNWPQSILAWDVIVLNIYFILNLVIVTSYLYKTLLGKPYEKKFLVALALLSIPAAVSIHTVTAFLYNVMPARPYWNASILVPRFLASAFCSGPALMIITFQILRKTTHIKISNEALWKIAELMAYAMAFNLLLFLAEVVKEYYSHTHHLIHLKYYMQGLGDNTVLVPYAWTSIITSVLAFLIFIIPKTRKNIIWLNIGCVLIYAGVYIEKGMGLVLPGFTPSTLGEIYPYSPSLVEVLVFLGVWGLGLLAFTLMSKIAVAILLKDFTAEKIS